MVIDLCEIILSEKIVLSLVGANTMPLNTMGASWIVYNNSRGPMSKSTVIDTFWHGLQRVAILAALDTELKLGTVHFN